MSSIIQICTNSIHRIDLREHGDVSWYSVFSLINTEVDPSLSHLPVERYAGVISKSDEWRPALARRARRSRHLCRLGVRSELKTKKETSHTCWVEEAEHITPVYLRTRGSPPLGLFFLLPSACVPPIFKRVCAVFVSPSHQPVWVLVCGWSKQSDVSGWDREQICIQTRTLLVCLGHSDLIGP